MSLLNILVENLNRFDAALKSFEHENELILQRGQPQEDDQAEEDGSGALAVIDGMLEWPSVVTLASALSISLAAESRGANRGAVLAIVGVHLAYLGTRLVSKVSSARSRPARRTSSLLLPPAPRQPQPKLRDMLSAELVWHPLTDPNLVRLKASYQEICESLLAVLRRDHTTARSVAARIHEYRVQLVSVFMESQLSLAQVSAVLGSLLHESEQIALHAEGDADSRRLVESLSESIGIARVPERPQPQADQPLLPPPPPTPTQQQQQQQQQQPSYAPPQTPQRPTQQQLYNAHTPQQIFPQTPQQQMFPQTPRQQLQQQALLRPQDTSPEAVLLDIPPAVDASTAAVDVESEPRSDESFDEADAKDEAGEEDYFSADEEDDIPTSAPAYVVPASLYVPTRTLSSPELLSGLQPVVSAPRRPLEAQRSVPLFSSTQSAQSTSVSTPAAPPSRGFLQESSVERARKPTTLTQESATVAAASDRALAEVTSPAADRAALRSSGAGDAPSSAAGVQPRRLSFDHPAKPVLPADPTVSDVLHVAFGDDAAAAADSKALVPGGAAAGGVVVESAVRPATPPRPSSLGQQAREVLAREGIFAYKVRLAMAAVPDEDTFRLHTHWLREAFTYWTLQPSVRDEFRLGARMLIGRILSILGTGEQEFNDAFDKLVRYTEDNLESALSDVGRLKVRYLNPFDFFLEYTLMDAFGQLDDVPSAFITGLQWTPSYAKTGVIQKFIFRDIDAKIEQARQAQNEYREKYLVAMKSLVPYMLMGFLSSNKRVSSTFYEFRTIVLRYYQDLFAVKIDEIYDVQHYRQIVLDRTRTLLTDAELFIRSREQ